MKIVFLNTLNAEVTEPLRIFLQNHSPTTDVFCFQECYPNMRKLIAETLPEFTEHRATKPVLHGSVFTNVTLVRKTLTADPSTSNVDAQNTGLSLFTTIHTGGTQVHIANVHGLSQPGKLDNPDRLAQSEELLNTFAGRSGILIIGGDLNILPETESVALFERAGYQNLIQKYKIKTTRNEMSWSQYPGNELYYSDYVFIKGVSEASFEVPEGIISDHQPMILTVNI